MSNNKFVDDNDEGNRTYSFNKKNSLYNNSNIVNTSSNVSQSNADNVNNLVITNSESNYETLEEYFKKNQIKFEIIGNIKSNSLFEEAKLNNINYESFIRAQLIHDENNKYLIIADIDKIIDYKLLCENIHENIKYLSSKIDVEKKFYNANINSYVPFPNLLGIQGIIDTSLNLSKDIHLVSSNIPGSIIKIKGADFEKIHKDCKKLSFSYPLSRLGIKQNLNENILLDKFSCKRIKSRLIETEELPIIPVMASEILKLRVNPDADVLDLAGIIEKDPSLSAQLISWARSPYYGFQGKITSIQDAIIKVLGYDLVINVALGIAISKVMKVPNEGIIGLKEFWRHSIYSAILVEKLINIMPFRKQPHKGLAYLCGLLHNFGYLLIGQLFPPHFKLLNQTIELNREINVIHLENKIFDTNHQQIGGWLMEAWHLPKELICTCMYHHIEDYFDEHSIYVNLVYIADYLLSKKGVGDKYYKSKISNALLENVGFTYLEAEKKLENLWEQKEDIESLVNSLNT